MCCVTEFPAPDQDGARNFFAVAKLLNAPSIEHDRRTTMLPATLDDLKVLDLSQGLAGPLCAKILGDFGADVIKVEPPGGDAARSMAPHFGNDPHPEKSLVFLLANLNKRGVRLNLEAPEGRELLRQMARTSDVIVESFAPGSS
jgi:crotonobetainyl-CoA:carnitine CoA-transferase CaiB-like acyl-CoA transferase